MHVLVVEDDARLAEALARILQDNGYATDVVHDGEAGVQYGGTGTYDVIILDVMLPKMDGFAVASTLRRKGVSTPVLLLTARDAIADRVAHPLYKKIVKRTYKLKAHDENNQCGVGDRVRVMETRPLSKDKRWRVVEIIEKAK